MLRRDAWFEWDDDCTLAIAKWTTDTEALATAIKETGWVHSTGAAMAAAEDAMLAHGWFGYIDREPVICSESGATAVGDRIPNPSPVTLARMPPGICS